MSPTHTINVARDFSKEPIGRYTTDGESSGEVFRVKLLAPALCDAEVVRVILDGTEGYGSSFLDEAFAGLLRARILRVGEFDRRIELVSEEDPSLKKEVQDYVAQEEARQRSR
jgi:hypothetical protein